MMASVRSFGRARTSTHGCARQATELGEEIRPPEISRSIPNKRGRTEEHWLISLREVTNPSCLHCANDDLLKQLFKVGIGLLLVTVAMMLYSS